MDFGPLSGSQGATAWKAVQASRAGTYKCQQRTDPEDDLTRCVRPAGEPHDVHVNGYGDQFMVVDGKPQVVV